MRLSSFAVPILSASAAFALSKLPRPYRRAPVDGFCGSLNSDLILNDVINSHGKATVAGHIDVCLCLSDVVKFVESNVVAQKAVKLLGDHVKVEALISGMVKDLPTGSHCSYPDHARALCTDSNPCDFECTDGYLAFPAERPTSCICPDNLMECDGKCGQFTTCPSKAPPSRRTNEPRCASGRTMCGIPGTSTGQPWKCVDVKTDPTTCGGCCKASPFGNAPVTGVNCKEIKGVNPDTVTCGNGRCIVKDCAEGFVVAPSSDSCIPVPKYAAAGSKQQSGATIPGPSGLIGGIEGLKVSRDELIAALKHGAGIAIAPFGGPVGGPKTRDVITGGIDHGTSVVRPILGATQKSPRDIITGGIQHGTGIVKSILGATPKTPRDFITGGIQHGTGIVKPILGATSKTPRDVITGSIQHGTGILKPILGATPKTPRGNQHGTDIVKPMLGATKHLTTDGSAGPAGVVAGVVQGAKVVAPVAGAVEGTSAGFKTTRNVGLAHGAGGAPIEGIASSLTAGRMGTFPFPGIHGVRGVEEA